MVQGLAQLERRWKAIPDRVREEVRKAMEAAALGIVADMDRLKPLPEIEIGWTWGEAPAGSMVLGKVGGKDYGALRITIFAKGATFDARWFEFGTAPRFHKSGKYVGQIAAVPFFFPVWRVWRRRVKARITAAIKRGLKTA